MSGELPTSSLADSVTVIIPAYNAERFIRRALDSVLAQTHAASQIVVVDDGSRDRTRELIQEQYGQAVTILQQQNGGPARARNAGLRIATGEFIAFLDADDWWEPRKLAAQIEAFHQNPQAILNYTGLRWQDEETGAVRDSAPENLETLPERLRYCNPGVPPSSVMVRRAVLQEVGGFNERQIGSEDWDLWFRLVRKGPFCTVTEPLTDYRVSSGGLSGNADHMFGDFLRMLDSPLLDGLNGTARRIWKRRIVSYQAFKASLTARGAGDRAKERAYALRSLKTWPSPFWAPERFRFIAATLLKAR